MNLTYSRIKTLIPELNTTPISPERLKQVLNEHRVEVHEVKIEKQGYFISSDGRNFVFLRYGLAQILAHEVLAHECIHALTAEPAAVYLTEKQEQEADALALVCLIPLSQLFSLNQTAHQLDVESFELLRRRNEIYKKWNL